MNLPVACYHLYPSLPFVTVVQLTRLDTLKFVYNFKLLLASNVAVIRGHRTTSFHTQTFQSSSLLILQKLPLITLKETKNPDISSCVTGCSCRQQEERH